MIWYETDISLNGWDVYVPDYLFLFGAWPFKILFMQADSAILALNCSGIVLGTLPVRQEHFFFCMCSKVLTMVRVSVAHFFAYPTLYCWFLQGEPIKDTSPPSSAPCDVILSLAHLKPSFRAANFWVLSRSRVALETVVPRISNCCWAEFSLVKNLV